MGRSSIRDESKKKKESSKSHKLAALTNSPYDEHMEEIEEDEKPDPHRVERSELVEGDHIYKWSASTAYAHHGICIGHDMVIHFVNLTEGSSSSTPGLPGLLSKLSKAASTPSGPSSIARSSQMISTASSLGSYLHGRYLKNDKSSRGMELLTCSNSVECGYGPFGTGVFLSCLNCFLRRENHSLCRYEYGVLRSTFEMEVRGGTCTTAESDSPEEVIQRARYLLEKGFGKYHLEKNNCEDFALYCKTGLLVLNKSAPATSGQINYALSSLSSGEKLPRQVTTHGSKRYYRDIGVRNDVVKVEVKNVAVVLNRRVGLNEVPAD